MLRCGSDSRQRERELSEENAQLRASLEVLRSGLCAGHEQLADALEQLLHAANGAEQQRAVQVSERQISLYAAFLGRAVAIAADASTLTASCSQERRGLGTSRRRGTLSRVLRSCMRVGAPPPPRVAPPAFTAASHG